MRFVAENTGEIEINIGKEFILENLNVAIVPPNLNLEEFILLPDFLKCIKIEYPEQEGSYESHFYLSAISSGYGTLTVGYKNLDFNNISTQKEIKVKVS